MNNLPMNNLPMNNLPMNNLPMNGLSQASLAANQDLLAALATRVLDEDVLVEDPVDGARLASELANNEYSADLVRYIASCALDPCEWIVVPKDLMSLPAKARARLQANVVDKASLTGVERDRGVNVIPGELGLCGASSGDSWAGGKPSKDCLERVSACMLARTNALDAKIMISMRGPGMKLSDFVPVNTLYREASGTPIVSFTPAAACSPDDLRNRRGNCGWQPMFVGRCVVDAGAGAREVTVEVPSPADDVDVRVCAGMYGCDDPGGGPRTRVNGSPEVPPYAGGLVVAGTHRVDFPCAQTKRGPRDEQGRETGYFSVMARSRSGRALASGAASATFAAPEQPHDRYPAPEAEVFTYREGAFFGNLFTKLPPREERRDIMLGGDQFACFSSVWSEGVAMLERRICANVTQALPKGCFENLPGPCDATRDPAPRSCPAGLPCAAHAQIPGMCTLSKDEWPIASSCTTSSLPTIANRGTKWASPYTTYLNQPCDLVGPRCLAFLEASVRSALP